MRHGPVLDVLARLPVAALALCGSMFPHAAPGIELGSARFAHLTVNEGLSQSSVNALLQDRRGFLWVGTQDGLNRYGGYRFEVLRHDPANPRSLASNHVLALFEDRDGVLWIATTGGALHRHRPRTDDFDRFLLRLPATGAGRSESPRPEVRAIRAMQDGRLLLGTSSHGLLLFDPSTNTLARPAALAAYRVHALTEGHDGALWVGTSVGLAMLHRSDVEVGETAAVRPIQWFTDSDTRAIAILRNGDAWVPDGTHRIRRLSPAGETMAVADLPSAPGTSPGEVRALLADSRDRLWVGRIGAGIAVIGPQGQVLGVFSELASDPYSLPTNTVVALLEDRAGVIWAGSLAAGLSRTAPGSGFEHLRHVPEDPASLSHNMVNELVEDATGGLWVGTSGGGVSYLAPGASGFRHFRSETDDPATLSSDRVWGMHLAANGTLWVGTWGGGLNRLDTATGAVHRFPSVREHPGGLPGSIVTAIIDDGEGGILVGMADAGLDRLQAGAEAFESIPLPGEAAEGDRPANITTLRRDSRGRLWVGTWNRGLCRSEPHSISFSCYRHDPLDHRSLNDDNVRMVAEDGRGALWIATGNGIARYDEQNKSFDRHTAADGLVPGVIYAILPEDDGVLWLSSNGGLMRYDTHRRQARRYEYRDGLQANEFNGEAALKTGSGHMLFGGVGGITRFHPDELRDNPVAPQVVITGFSLFNRTVTFQRDDPSPVLTAPISETRELWLRHDQNFIGFEFAGLHFANPAANRYAYRLDGFDDDWTETDASRRFASYSNLDPGHYLFRIRAANGDGVWSTDEAAIAIIIAPPWWLTWWATLVWVVLAMLALSAFVRWRLREPRLRAARLATEVEHRTAEVVAQKETIERQAIRLRDALESKERFFAQLSHEFRTPITLILGPIDETLRAGVPAPVDRALTLARRSGERLLHLVDQLLTLARHGGQAQIERRPVALEPIVRLVAAEFDSAARQRSLELAVEIGEDVIVASNPEALQGILINLVSNAVKYTPPGGRVAIELGREGDEAVLRISDTGIGIAAEDLPGLYELFERATTMAHGTGVGLTVVKELVDAHGGRIAIESAPGVGTAVTVHLPALQGDAGAGTEALAPVGIDPWLDPSPDTGSALPLADAPPPAEASGPEILIVDDNEDMRRFLVGLLSPHYQCLEAEDGAAGLATAIERIPDAIVCDVMMPGVDGFELLRRLRGDERSSHIPVVMLTARGDEASRLEGLRERADDYLAKPFNADELRLRLRNLLELGELRAARARQHLIADTTEPVRQAPPVDLSPREHRFIERLESAMATRFADPAFGAIELAEAVFMSPRQLQRKLKALLGISPAAYIRDFRLTRAREALESGRPVTDVALDCGFSSPSHFSQSFRARFGTRPSEWRQAAPTRPPGSRPHADA